eukprot:scaffold145784_cov23-Tisochrysis_lutea.AAC.1
MSTRCVRRQQSTPICARPGVAARVPGIQFASVMEEVQVILSLFVLRGAASCVALTASCTVLCAACLIVCAVYHFMMSAWNRFMPYALCARDLILAMYTE